MSGTAPPSPSDDEARTPADGAAERVAAPRSRQRAGWVVAAVAVVVLAVLLVTRPWSTSAAPEPTAPAASSPAPTPSPTPTVDVVPDEPTPSPTSTPVSPPGADAVFDATSTAALLVTRADLEQAVPAAAAGLVRELEPGTSAWGLPEGAVVDPPQCQPAVTVVNEPPVHHDATAWGNDEMRFEQDVVVLPDAAAASEAFRALVTTVDTCVEYTRVVGGVAGTTWTAEPALEGQGVFPAIVQDVTAVTAGDSRPQVTGHVLVGNAIVSWTATGLTAADQAEARAVLGAPADLSAVVEERALAAVRALT